MFVLVGGRSDWRKASLSISLYFVCIITIITIIISVF